MSLLTAILEEELRLKEKLRYYNGLAKKERKHRVNELIELESQFNDLKKLLKEQTQERAKVYATLYHKTNIAKFLDSHP